MRFRVWNGDSGDSDAVMPLPMRLAEWSRNKLNYDTNGKREKREEERSSASVAVKAVDSSLE